MRTLISIHALLAESDRGWCSTMAAQRNFYPRSPCGERPAAPPAQPAAWRFLSTLSLRRATIYNSRGFSSGIISIHALLAESDGLPGRKALGAQISIHALLAESDIGFPHTPTVCVISIHALLAESDEYQAATRQERAISIHALLAESDRLRHRYARICMDFYPRSPCGERLSTLAVVA